MAKATKKQTGKVTKADSQVANWFKTGDDGLQTKKAQDTLRTMSLEKQAGRFYLSVPGGKHKDGSPIKENESQARVIFVDDSGMYCHVHEIWKDVGGKSYIPCVKEFRPCAVCQKEGKNPIYTAHYTIIDTREFVKKDGAVSKNRKIILNAKGAAIYMIADLKKKYGSLVGVVFDIKRYSKEQPTCGGTFDKVGKLTTAQWEKLAKEAKTTVKEIQTPVDYMKVLALPTEDELSAMGYGDLSVIGSTSEMEETEIEL